jgi:hypothetical protein
VLALYLQIRYFLGYYLHSVLRKRSLRPLNHGLSGAHAPTDERCRDDAGMSSELSRAPVVFTQTNTAGRSFAMAVSQPPSAVWAWERANPPRGVIY